MKRTAALAVLLFLLSAGLAGQGYPSYPASASTPAPASTPAAAAAATPTTAPTSLLAQIDQASQATQQDLAGLRIDKWKTDSSDKAQLQQQAAALRRNLSAALPELVGQVRAHPDDLAANFKLYRNLNALYDVLVPLADSAGRLGSQDDYQTLAREASAFDAARRAFADRMESLSASRDAEITRLRSQLQAKATPPPPAKKTVIDDTKSASKTKSKKKPAAAASSSHPSTPQ